MTTEIYDFIEVSDTIDNFGGMMCLNEYCVVDMFFSLS